MWSKDDILQLTKWEVSWWRFDFENVESSGGNLAALKGVEEGNLIDQTAARTIYDPRAFFHSSQTFTIEEMFGLARHRHVQGHEISASKYFV
jgi:hypothetical protein